jgi:hypothetical protein
MAQREEKEGKEHGSRVKIRMGNDRELSRGGKRALQSLEWKGMQERGGKN